MISIIAALQPDHCIGIQGHLPWRQFNDLQRFKQLTMGSALIMGRKTYDSIGRNLPGRTSIVLSKSQTLVTPYTKFVPDLPSAIAVADSITEKGEIFVVGGSEIFKEALPLATRMYLTVVHAKVKGDTYFPPLTLLDWQMRPPALGQADDRNEFAYDFRIYDRIQY
jgi:dihydrofolate reductase